MNLKQAAATKAVGLIKNNTIVGLGAGSTMGYMVDFIADAMQNGLQLQILSSSFTTRSLLLQKGFKVLEIGDMAAIDIYFDGCDLVDKNLNALKSGGGIHTLEKLLASMAKEFILVVDGSKKVDQFNSEIPLVIEFLPQALNYVPASILKLYKDARITIRCSDKREGPVVTENGNYLLDIWFTVWPALAELSVSLKKIAGIVDSSLFYEMVQKVVIADKDGVEIIQSSM